MHDYKFLSVAVMICAALVNTRTDTEKTDTQADQLLTSYTISSIAKTLLGYFI